MIQPHDLGAGALFQDPIGDLLGGLAAEVAAERWVLVARHGAGWADHSGSPSHRDALWRQVASGLSKGPDLSLVDTETLGDAGRRLHAAGVKTVAIARLGSGSAFGFLENPDEARVHRSDGGGLLRRLGELVPHLLEATWRMTELETLGRWLPSLQEMSSASIEEAEALRRLGELSGAASLVLVRPRGTGVDAFAAWREGPRLWQTYGGFIGLEAALGDGDSARDTVDSVARTVGLVSPAEWTVGVSFGNRPLALALSGGRHSTDGVAVLASLLAAAGQRHRDVSAARTNALLQERARIASVIHEGITQVLTNVAIQMEVLDRALEDPERGRKMLGAMRSAVLEALDSLRGAILEMTPAAPEWSDLAGGLERFVGDFASQWGLELSYSIEGEARDIEPETLALVFGFVQEALSNVRKHAGTSEAAIRLTFTPDSVAVEVSDEGEGFDPKGGLEEGFRRHQGLTILRSRARLAGARFDVDSSPGEGTQVRLEVGV
jgi:signal transduction histidine kinase